MQDAKAQGSYADLLKRIEALESRPTGNINAPKIRGLKLGFSIRHRFELRTDPNGNEAAPDSDFTLQRTRIYLDADVNKNIRGYVKLQDVRTFGAEQSTVGNLARVDLLEGYVDLRNLGDLNPLLKNINVRVGRWQWFYGEHRLIGHLNWANESRSYDGARIRYDNKKNIWVDFFAANISEDQTGGVSGEGSGAIPAPGAGVNRDELFWGAYGHFEVTKGIAIEPYEIIRQRSRDANPPFRSAGAIAGEQRYTSGARIKGKKIPWLPGVDFTFEQAWQHGRVEFITNRSQRIQAFAGAWGGGYTFNNVPWKPRIGYDYVMASGDKRPGAGAAKTFSQLYPTGHARLGYIDFHGWQNIRDHQIHLAVKPTKKLLMKVDFHIFEADEDRDAWFTVGGGAPGVRLAAPDPGGGFDGDYGEEIDITVKYKLFKNFTVVGGYSHYFIDDAIENIVARNTGSTTNDDDTDWFYLMTIMKF
ncbi:MAG: alginate export family protein [Candidatus Scalinduaceae bacterium]